MTNRVFFPRVVTLASIYLAALVFGHASAGQSLHLADPLLEIDGIEVRPRANTESFTFEGSVYGPDGGPAAGAVLLSSAGGQAIVDAVGNFRLVADVPVGATKVQVTAIGGTGGGLATSQSVTLLQGSGRLWVGAFRLEKQAAGTADWLPAFGQEPGTSDFIHALAVFDDGNGAALFAGGRFYTAGGLVAPALARWDGVRWTDVGGSAVGPSNEVFALAVYDDGGGEALFVGGDFDSVAGVPANNIAKWDGTDWTALGDGTRGDVLALATFKDGRGEGLFVGGKFDGAGRLAVKSIARWNGTGWAPLGGGTNPGVSRDVNSLAVFDDGSGPAFFVAGTSSDSGDNNLSKWGCLDTTAPVIVNPTSVSATDSPTNGPGEEVFFTVTATDETDPEPILVVTPLSGSHFAVGTTLVTCTSTDASGNQSSSEFSVLVRSKTTQQWGFRPAGK